MAQQKEPEDDLLEGLLPSTVREVDSHAECFSTSSFRSGSPQKVEELLEVESFGHRYFWQTSSNILFNFLKTQRAG